MKGRKFFCKIFLLVFIFSTAQPRRLLKAQGQPEGGSKKPADYSSITSGLRERVTRLMAEAKVPGVAVALVDGGESVWADGYGHTDLSGRVAVTADTLFSVQSVSKTYSAAGVLVAVDQGLMALDDPVRKHLPGFTVRSRFGPDQAGRITLRQLLSHRAGLPHEAPVGNNFSDRPSTFSGHVRSIYDTWLKFPVGARYSYSNLGIDLAGYLLQVRSGRPFERFIKEELFAPLGMTASTFSQEQALKTGDRARGNTETQTFPDIPIPIVPSGGMYSTVRDMAKFVSFNLTGRVAGGRRVLSERLLREMHTPQFAVAGQVGGYGIGVDTAPWHGGTLLFHRGNGYGFAADQRWSPEYQVGVVVLSNAEHGIPFTDRLANDILTEMVKVKYGSLPPDKELKFTDKPAVTLNADEVGRLAGTYGTRGSIVTLKAAGADLYLSLGPNDVKFTAHSPTEFTLPGHMAVFDLDASGKPKGLLHLSALGVEYLPLNDRPGEEAGPNKAGWRKYVGEYEGRYTRIIPQKAQVSLKNGHLYLGWQGDWKLTEYRPGLFFTSDGEAIIFRNGLLLLGNRPFARVK